MEMDMIRALVKYANPEKQKRNPGAEVMVVSACQREKVCTRDAVLSAGVRCERDGGGGARATGKRARRIDGQCTWLVAMWYSTYRRGVGARVVGAPHAQPTHRPPAPCASRPRVATRGRGPVL